MPGMDRTGPAGEGPLTGRGLGPCGRGLGFRRGFGRGLGTGFGRGLGRGFGRGFFQQPTEMTKEQKVKILEADKAEVEAELEDIKKEIKETKDEQWGKKSIYRSY